VSENADNNSLVLVSIPIGSYQFDFFLFEVVTDVRQEDQYQLVLQKNLERPRLWLVEQFPKNQKKK
jgi:hypothetical protein